MRTRAIAAADKTARRNHILAAARQQFVADGRQLPAVATIADAAGLAKGTVYLYFRTKEEIFVALLAQEFAGLLDEVEATFLAEAIAPAQRVASFIPRYVAYLQAHPELLRLDAMSYSLLEQNLSEAQLRTFKLELTQRLVAVGAVVDAALTQRPGRGTELLLRTYALTRGLWQSLDFPESLRQILAEPQFAPIRPPFGDELKTALSEYWRGALALT